MTLESQIDFNSKVGLSTIVQYDNVSDEVGINLRLRYNVEAGRDIWFVVNHSMYDDPIENRFRSTQTAGVVKVRYTFRY